MPRYNFDEEFESQAKARGWIIFEPEIKYNEKYKDYSKESAMLDSYLNYFKRIKENKKMTILEMLNKAEKDGKTYCDYDMRYNKKYGFHDSEGDPWGTKLFSNVNEIFEGDHWEELDPEDDVDYEKPMSIEEIEEELGYKIKIVPKK